jgi:hypothetical protein
MRRLPWFPSACVSLGLLLTTGSAFAQSIEVKTPLRPGREERGNPNRLQPNQVNRTDCLAGDVIEYPVVVSGITSSIDLEVWAGSNCEDLSNRASNSATCWLVYEDANPQSRNIQILVQDVIAGRIDRGSYGRPGSGSAEVCDKGQTSVQSVSLNFFLINSADEVASKPSTAPTVEFDLLGPDPPLGVKAGVGENSLVVSFDSDDGADDEISKYYVYCDVATGGSECSSSLLVPDQPPPDSARCGSTTKNAQEVQTDDDLENGVLYAVGVAAVDGFGNPGKLSSIACATPEPINGFFEQYRAAGGKGGGGFCSLSRSDSARGLWLGAAALAGSLLVRRRVKGGRRS